MSVRPADKEVAAQFNGMKQELSAIASKIGELEMEKEEHQLVIDTIQPMDAQRTCFRLVGGVLVERQVKDVLPAVQANLEGILQIIKQLAETYKKKEDDLAVYQKKYNIQVRG